MSEVPIEFIADTLISKHANSYRILDDLGSGGNATAFMAVATAGRNKGTLFAVKFFTNPMTKRREAFEREIEFLYENRHPAILPVYDFGTHRKVPFYVSQHMGTDLAKLMQAGSIPEFDKFLYASQLAAAVEFLGARGRVHRDIKPANVFVNGKTLMLGDFGMLYRIGDDDEDTTPTRRYRSPDVVRRHTHGDAITVASDVFQLGLVLIELFTGTNIEHDCKNLSDPVDLDEIGEIPIGNGELIRQILKRMVDPEPSERYSTRDLLDITHAFLTNHSPLRLTMAPAF